MTHYSLYLKLVKAINLNWRWLLPQPIVLKVPKEADVENWVMYDKIQMQAKIHLNTH